LVFSLRAFAPSAFGILLLNVLIKLKSGMGTTGFEPVTSAV
jgi:hypothetical protein